MAAVEGPDAPHKAVIQRLILGIRVLPPLYRLMVRGAVAVGVNLPAVSAQVIVGPLGYLLLHQAEAAHDVAPHSGFQRGMHAGFVVDPAHTLFGEIPRGLPDGGVVVRRPGGNLRKREIHASPVCIPQRQRTAIWIYHAEGLGDVGQVALRKLYRRRHDLLDRLVLLERDSLHLRQAPEVVVIPGFRALGQKPPQFLIGDLQKLLEPLLDLPL